MKTKLIALCISFFLFTLSPTLTQAFEPSGEIQVAVLSAYLNTPQSGVNEEWVLQWIGELNLPYGFSAKIFHSVGLEDSDLSSNTADEIALTLTWSHLFLDRLRLTAGVNYVDLVDEPAGNEFFNEVHEGDVILPFAKVSMTFPLNRRSELHPYIYSEFPMSPTSWRGGAPTRGVISQVGVAQEWRPRSTTRIRVSGDWSLIHDDGAYGKDPGDFVRGETEISYLLPCRRLEITLFGVVKYIRPLFHPSETDGRDEHLLGGGGIRLRF